MEAKTAKLRHGYRALWERRVVIALLRLALFVLVFLGTGAHASFPVPAGGVGAYRAHTFASGPAVGAAGTVGPAAAVCAAEIGYSYPTFTPTGFTWVTGSNQVGCKSNKPDGTDFSPLINLTYGALPAACPANSTGSTTCTCNTGFDQSGSACVPHVNQCAAKIGLVGVLNWTQGYTRSPDEGDSSGVGPVALPPSSGTVCEGGCAVSLQTAGPGVSYYVSQQATDQGLYRRSADYPSVGLGTECTAGAADTPAKKDTPAPACPGAVGEVNGKTVCTGTAAKPVTVTPMGQPPATPIAGNPAAGAKPATGEGSGVGSAGRTPATGTGGAAGGGSGAAVGGKGGAAGGTSTGKGTTAAPGTGEEQAACGAPGQPKCSIDETGTPTTGANEFASGTAKADAAKDAAKAQIDAAGSMGAPSWSFSFQLPTGCSSFQVANFKGTSFNMNPCTYQSTIHDLMSMIWAAVTVMTIIGMVGRTIRES